MTDPKSLVRQQFGAHAKAYATSVVHAKGASLKRLIELVKPQADWRALDVATGAGHTALAFAPHVARVIASDLTQEMLAETRALADERGATNVETATADAEALPWPDGSFDLVTCRIAPHHFPHPEMFVAEVFRVLEAGGTFALVDNIAPDEVLMPGLSPAAMRDAAITYNAFEKIRDPSHARALAMSEWRELLVDAGFVVQHEERVGKDMEFESWARRVGADQATVERLEAMLTSPSGALAAFLGPRRDNDELWLTCHEGIVVAVKPV